MKNKLTVIGYMSDKVCFLNVDRNEAIERYIRDTYTTPVTIEDIEKLGIVTEFEFKDVFEAYDAYEI